MTMQNGQPAKQSEGNVLLSVVGVVTSSDGLDSYNLMAVVGYVMASSSFLGHFFSALLTTECAGDHLQDPRVYEESADSLTAHLTNAAAEKVKKINTAWLTIMEIVLVVLLWVSGFVIPHLYKDKTYHHSAFSVMLYVAVGVWVIQFLMDRYYTREHYMQRLYGYESFSRDTHGLRKVPLMVASAEMAVLLVACQVVSQECSSECKTLPREDVLSIIISVFCAVQIILLCIYLVKTLRFNRSNTPPDVFRDEVLAGSLDVNSSDVGFRDENLLEQLLERQQDVIRYYKHHNAQLSKRLITLSDENRSLKIGKGAS